MYLLIHKLTMIKLWNYHQPVTDSGGKLQCPETGYGFGRSENFRDREILVILYDTDHVIHGSVAIIGRGKMKIGLDQICMVGGQAVLKITPVFCQRIQEIETDIVPQKRITVTLAAERFCTGLGAVVFTHFADELFGKWFGVIRIK